ncbi:CPBP family intramembrane glutamic endopeptidase [Neobacillus niacini]|uniref:CPBP family intramembrane glutamic endopeptidase n=1 Tax=Neobacillus niacini TaxID=86668 RepID=UPI00203CD1F2|nr:CPBP family intramembrane glutamic endopeptidase [Neobacillus niacini]MCM3694153.1 CPBP family intramembrane metalloprotease [Neobacillus niacini]
MIELIYYSLLGVVIISKLIKAVVGFLALDLYFVFVPSLLDGPFLQFSAYLVFFPIAYFIANWVGLNGLKGMGLLFHQGWLKNFILSFGIGFSFWMVMFGIQLLSGDLKWNSIREPSELLMPVLMIVVGFFIGSFINDLIVRGFIINLLKDKLHVGWVFTISILIYALDDYWYAGFSLSNFIFSVILGLSLTYAFYKTGSIWANTGIHYGLNVAYGLFFGMVGIPGTSIFVVEEAVYESLVSEVLYYLIPALMFITVLLVFRFYSQNTNDKKNAPLSIDV